MNCNTCKCYGDNPISGMCEGCNNGSKHSNKNEKATNLKPCPFCGAKGFEHQGGVMCENSACFMFHATVSEIFWNKRPIEESLQNTIESMKSCLNCEYNDVDTYFGDSCLHADAKNYRNKFKRDCLARNKKYWQLVK
jgi:hypothetical protein